MTVVVVVMLLSEQSVACSFFTSPFDITSAHVEAQHRYQKKKNIVVMAHHVMRAYYIGGSFAAVKAYVKRNRK